jgi:hypothetical protein
MQYNLPQNYNHVIDLGLWLLKDVDGKVDQLKLPNRHSHNVMSLQNRVGLHNDVEEGKLVVEQASTRVYA